MLEVNEAIGFWPVGHAGCWRKGHDRVTHQPAVAQAEHSDDPDLAQSARAT